METRRSGRPPGLRRRRGPRASAVRSSPSRTTSLPPTNRCASVGAPNTSVQTGSAMPLPASPSTRQTAMSASLPTSSEPSSSSRPRQRAPPTVAARRLSRAVSASGPPRNRAASSAWCSSSTIRPDSLDADPSTPSPTGTPASSRSRIRRDARPEPRVGRRAVRHAGAGGGEPGDRGVGEVHAVGEPHVVAEPTEVLGVLDRACAPNVARQNSSSSRVSAEVGVHAARPRARASAAESRISSAVTENGEQGATAICSIASGDGSCQRVDGRLGRGEDRVVVLDDRVRRQPTGGRRPGPSSRGSGGTAARLAAPR